MRAVLVVPATEDTIPPIVSTAKKAGKVASVDAAPNEAVLAYCRAEGGPGQQRNETTSATKARSCLVYFDSVGLRVDPAPRGCACSVCSWHLPYMLSRVELKRSIRGSVLVHAVTMQKTKAKL